MAGRYRTVRASLETVLDHSFRRYPSGLLYPCSTSGLSWVSNLKSALAKLRQNVLLCYEKDVMALSEDTGVQADALVFSAVRSCSVWVLFC